jgi:hypothetical protein
MVLCREENRRLREYAGMLGGDPAAFLGEMVSECKCSMCLGRMCGGGGEGMRLKQ